MVSFMSEIFTHFPSSFSEQADALLNYRRYAYGEIFVTNVGTNPRHFPNAVQNDYFLRIIPCKFPIPTSAGLF